MLTWLYLDVGTMGDFCFPNFVLLYNKSHTYKKIGVERWTYWLSESPSTLSSACVPRTHRVAQIMLFRWPEMVGSGWLTVSCEPHSSLRAWLCLSNEDQILKAPKGITVHFFSPRH